jgi:hypothetical protein
MTQDPRIDELIAHLTRDMTDKGRLIEAGWISMRLMALPKDAPEFQVRDMRWAFFAGAQHLFASIMTLLEPDAEPSEADLNRMTLIVKELEQFVQEAKREGGPGDVPHSSAGSQ